MWSSLIQLDETEGDWDDATAQVEPAPERPRWARIALGGLAGLAAILLGVAILVIGTGKGKIKDTERHGLKCRDGDCSKKDRGSAETRAVPTIPRGTSSPISTETVTNDEIDRGVLVPRPEARPPVESLNPTPAPTAATLESHEIAAFKLPDPVIQVRWLREGGRVMIETGERFVLSGLRTSLSLRTRASLNLLRRPGSTCRSQAMAASRSRRASTSPFGGGIFRRANHVNSGPKERASPLWHLRPMTAAPSTSAVARFSIAT